MRCSWKLWIWFLLLTSAVRCQKRKHIWLICHSVYLLGAYTKVAFDNHLRTVYRLDSLNTRVCSKPWTSTCKISKQQHEGRLLMSFVMPSGCQAINLNWFVTIFSLYISLLHYSIPMDTMSDRELTNSITIWSTWGWNRSFSYEFCNRIERCLCCGLLDYRAGSPICIGLQAHATFYRNSRSLCMAC